ncbi:hypothetical protein MAR_030863, partial [Mya arenaria]
GVLRRLVRFVIQSGRSVDCELSDCTIKPEEDARQLQVEMENQSPLQLVALQPVSSDYTTHITLDDTIMSEGVFRRLVRFVIQSGHSVNCDLSGCTIEHEEDVRQLQVEMENQSALQLVALQPVSSDYTTHITLDNTSMSAGVFRRLVSIVIQSGHSVKCEISWCSIKPVKDPFSSDYTTYITLENTTIAAGAFRRLVRFVIQSGHSVNCELSGCTIEHEEDVRQLQVEMENQSALQLVALQPVSSDYTTHITLHHTTIAKGVFRRLVRFVIQSGHSVNCKLYMCTIEPEEDVRQLQVEMENHSAVKLVTFLLEFSCYWSVEFNVNVK